VPKTLVRASIPPNRFSNHVAFTASIVKPSNFVEEVWSDAMMEESSRTFGGSSA
jgi:hypothetical protein